MKRGMAGIHKRWQRRVRWVPYTKFARRSASEQGSKAVEKQPNLDREQCLVDNIPLDAMPPDGEILDEIPDWAVALICHSQGKGRVAYTRQPERSWVENYGGDMGYDPTDHSGVDRDTSRRNRSRRNSSGGGKVEIAPGNLTQNEYRFWVGNAFVQSESGTCRWCGTYCADKKARGLHFDHKDNKCTRALRTVYDYNRGISPMYCFTCGKKTPSTRWGFPLCATRECIEGWQFKTAYLNDTFKEAVKVCALRGLMNEYMKTVDSMLFKQVYSRGH